MILWRSLSHVSARRLRKKSASSKHDHIALKTDLLFGACCSAATRHAEENGAPPACHAKAQTRDAPLAHGNRGAAPTVHPCTASARPAPRGTAAAASLSSFRRGLFHHAFISSLPS